MGKSKKKLVLLNTLFLMAKLYLFDIQNPVVYQMDVNTGEVNKVLEIFPDYQCKNPFIGDCVMVRLRMEGENEGDGYKFYIYS